MIISVIGAGGKTTVSLRLGTTLVHMGQKVLLTTTTHIYPPAGLPLTVGDAQSVRPLAPLTAAAKEYAAAGKLCGFSGKEVDDIDAKKYFDFILAEADGAKGRPLKAPAEWEPVYPSHTGLIIGVIGLDSLGGLANEETIHRSDLFFHITGAAPGEPVTLKHLLLLIQSPDGLFARAPKGARKTVILNKADLHKNPQETARILSEQSGVPVIPASEKMHWTDAFIKNYIVSERGNTNE
jgi:probable selenium-dependent hydroxylase accessory protein YqeC